MRSGSSEGIDAIVAGLSGLVASSAIAYLTTRWAKSASLRVVAAAFADIDSLLLTVLRSSLALSLLVEVAAFGICLGIVGVCWTMASGPLSANDPTPTLLPDATRLLTCFTVGALLATLVLQVSGTTYRLSSLNGSCVAARDASLGETDPRNPSAIADTAGIQLGQLIPQALDAFCSALCTNAIVVFVLWRIVGSSRLSREHAYLLVPLVVRSFGSLANVFGAAAARTVESLSPAPALLRAQAVVIVVSLGAIFGCGVWLTPDFGVRLAGCGALGLMLPSILGHYQRWLATHQPHGGRLERGTSEDPWNLGLVLGAAAVVVPLVLLFSSLAFVVHIGATLPVSHGRILALMVCLLGMNVALPFAVALQSSLPLVTMARRGAFLLHSHRDDSGHRRLARVEDAIRGAATWATSVQTQCSVGIPLFAAFAIGALAKDPDFRSFEMVLLAVVSVSSIAIVLPLAVGFGASSRATRAVVAEVRRQLPAGQTRSSGARISAEFTPSYRACVDVAARESVRQLSVPMAVAVAPGLVLGVALVWATKNPGQVGHALAMYLGQVAIAVLVAGFVFEVADGFANSSRNRPSRAVSDIPAVDSAVHHLAVNTTPVVRFLAKATVIAALTFVPYMF
jgi:Na+/H+-translocating membrane pyrophosphatase